MKYLQQFFLIVCVSAAGELLHALIPLPVPGSVYGLLLMLFCLLTGIIRLPQVEETAQYLIGIMPVMFIPATTGLMDAWDTMRQMLLPLFVISFVSTFLVMIASGKTVDFLMGRQEKRTGKNDKKDDSSGKEGAADE